MPHSRLAVFLKWRKRSLSLRLGLITGIQYKYKKYQGDDQNYVSAYISHVNSASLEIEKNYKLLVLVGEKTLESQELRDKLEAQMYREAWTTSSLAETCGRLAALLDSQIRRASGASNRVCLESFIHGSSQ